MDDKNDAAELLLGNLWNHSSCPVLYTIYTHVAGNTIRETDARKKIVVRGGNEGQYVPNVYISIVRWFASNV